MVAVAAGASSQAPEAARGADQPARTVATRTLGPQIRDLTIDSPALGRSAEVRLLLPRRFQAQPTRRWPVLWLLHGCCDTYQSWTRSTDVDELGELGDVLVVMPEAGEVGFYTDWYKGGRKGPPRWETVHLTELRQLLERDWRAGDRRVIAGLSMGGLGAMAYAARHPGMFRAAASSYGSGSCTDHCPCCWTASSLIGRSDAHAARSAAARSQPTTASSVSFTSWTSRWCIHCAGGGALLLNRVDDHERPNAIDRTTSAGGVARYQPGSHR